MNQQNQTQQNSHISFKDEQQEKVRKNGKFQKKTDLTITLNKKDDEVTVKDVPSCDGSKKIKKPRQQFKETWKVIKIQQPEKVEGKDKMLTKITYLNELGKKSTKTVKYRKRANDFVDKQDLALCARNTKNVKKDDNFFNPQFYEVNFRNNPEYKTETDAWLGFCSKYSINK